MNVPNNASQCHTTGPVDGITRINDALVLVRAARGRRAQQESVLFAFVPCMADSDSRLDPGAKAVTIKRPERPMDTSMLQSRSAGQRKSARGPEVAQGVCSSTHSQLSGQLDSHLTTLLLKYAMPF